MKKEKTRFIGKPLKITEDNAAMVVEWPRSLVHYHTYGQLSKFFRELKNGRLFATRCVNKNCPESRLWLPPRADCPDCLKPMEWEELPQPITGEIYTFTKVEYAGTGIELSTPYWQIDVKIPGLATIPKGYLLYGKPKIGMKVKAGFRIKNPANTILDLYWIPAPRREKCKS
jgi:uncharacterized OB-fold protein